MILSSCAPGSLLDTLGCPMIFELEDSQDEVDFVEPPPPECGFHAIVACPPKTIFEDDYWTPFSSYSAQPVEPPREPEAGKRTGIHLKILNHRCFECFRIVHGIPKVLKPLTLSRPSRLRRLKRMDSETANRITSPDSHLNFKRVFFG